MSSSPPGSTPTTAAGVWRFDGFVLDTQRYELRCGGEVIRVEPQVFDVLTQLVSNHDRFVSKEELFDSVWGGRFVGEAALAADYLGLSFDERYELISGQFPPWLLEEPIIFPRQHDTYGWACLVPGCVGAISDTDSRLICHWHGRVYSHGAKRARLDAQKT